MFKQSGWAVLAAVVLAGGASSAEARERVAFDGGMRPGTIVIRTSERRLYLTLGDGSAIRYPVAVGRLGKQWFGCFDPCSVNIIQPDGVKFNTFIKAQCRVKTR